MAETRKTLAIRAIKARAAHEKAKQAADKAERAHARAQAALWENLDDADETTVTIELGAPYGKVQFQKRSTIRARVPAELRSIAVASMEESGLAAALVSIEPHFNGKALNDTVRECLKNKQPIPDGVDWSETKYVTISLKG